MDSRSEEGVAGIFYAREALLERDRSTPCVARSPSKRLELGKHGGGPHMNFETMAPNPAKPGKMVVVDNKHVYLTDSK